MANSELEIMITERTAELRKANEQLQIELAERNKADETLRQTELEYRNLVESVQAIVWRGDARTFQFSFVSKEAETLLGYPAERWISDPMFWRDHIHAEDRDWAVSFCVRAIEERRDHVFEYRMIAADGRVVWLRDIVRVVVEGEGVRELVGVMVDITDRKRAEEMLRQSEQKFSTVFQTIPDSVAITRAKDGLFIDVNDLLLRAGVGWREGLVGHALVSAGLESQSGYTLLSDEPVIVEDFGRESRFNGPQLLRDHGVVSGISVIIAGRDRPFGVLGAHTAKGRTFTGDEINFLQAVANVLAEAIERKRAEEAIKTSREQMRALSAHLQSVREEERTSIAREIHDELGQALTGLKMDLSLLQKGLNKEGATLVDRSIEKTRSMSGLIDTTIETVRRIATQLRPGILDDLGLVAAIEWQAHDFQGRTGIDCRFTSGVEDLDLDRDRSTAAFRIFQETLTNVARHSEATSVEVSLNHQDHKLVLEIKDNGRGISEANIAGSRSLGLLGMRERAQLLGGELKVSGAPGKGTTVTVWIPVE